MLFGFLGRPLSKSLYENSRILLQGLFPDLVEVEVEDKDVDAGLAEDAKLTRRDLVLNELAHPVFGEAAGFGNTRNLEECRVGSNVGVETGAGGVDQVDGNGLSLVFLGQLVNRRLNAFNECLVGLGKVGSAGGRGIVTVACR